MPHIHTEPGQHDLTASAFIIRIDTPEPTIMFHMHKKLGKYMYFGGHVELDENPWQTLEHELQEESGYDLYSLMLLQPTVRIPNQTGVITHPSPLNVLTTEYAAGLNHYHTDISYAFVASAPPQNKPEASESEEFVLLTLDQIQQLPQDTITDRMRESAVFLLTRIYETWDQVSPALYRGQTT